MGGISVNIILVLIIAAALGLAGVALLARWVYLDAKSRGINPLPWVLLVIFISPNFIGLIIYALVRPKNRNEDKCASCGASIPADSQYCPRCGFKHEPLQELRPRKAPGFKLMITGAAMLAATMIIAIVFAVQQFSAGNMPLGSYTVGSVSNKWGNSWSMSFHTFQGSESAYFTAKSDEPHIVYESNITQGELSISIYEQNGEDSILVANIPINREGSLEGLVKGSRYRVVVTAEQARGSFSLKME